MTTRDGLMNASELATYLVRLTDADQRGAIERVLLLTEDAGLYAQVCGELLDMVGRVLPKLFDAEQMAQATPGSDAARQALNAWYLGDAGTAAALVVASRLAPREYRCEFITFLLVGATVMVQSGRLVLDE